MTLFYLERGTMSNVPIANVALTVSRSGKFHALTIPTVKPLENQTMTLEQKITELEDRLTELEAKLPKHSTPPSLIIEIEDLEEELENLKAQRTSQDPRSYA